MSADLALTAEQEQFADEVARAFERPDVRREVARVTATPLAAEPDPRPVYRQLGRLGLLAPGWPVELGGRGLGPIETSLVVEELVRRGVPETLHTLSVQIVGQLLLLAGSPEQRWALLPPLAAGERFATVLYSEAEAGSDLAALTTRAEPLEDGGFRVSGRKLYCVKSGLADLGLCAARAGDGQSRYAGISLLLVPLDAPGVRVETLDSLGDERFCAVELRDVRVGPDALLGRAGEGWGLLTGGLAIERTGVEHQARCWHWLELRARLLGDPAAAAPEALEALGRRGAEAEAARLLSWRVLRGVERGRPDPADAAMAKWYASEAARRAAWELAEVSGLPGCLDRDDPGAAAAGVVEAAYREAPGLTVSAGTSEMLLQLIAGSGLRGRDGDEELDLLQRQVRGAVRPAVERAAGPEARWTALAGLDLFALDAPLAGGGLELGQSAVVLACEELGRALVQGPYADTLTAVDCVAAAGPGGPSWSRLPELAAGRLRVAAVAVADEPVAAGGGWTLRGEAPFVRSAARADALLVVAGGRVLLVPASRPGWTLRRRAALAPLGLCAVALDGLRAEAADQVGPAATCLAADVVARVRLRAAARLVGLAGGALDAAVAWAHERRQFGRQLVEHQAVGFRLAELRALLEAARLLARHAAWLADAGRPALGAATEALATASELALRVSRDGMQVHGAAGGLRPAAAQRFYRHALAESRLAGSPPALWMEAGRLRAGRGQRVVSTATRRSSLA